ncbi:MAG TPA: penicillin acylase family protein, partial [Alphaproteobacteria bacterium]|nr:penicillin acylase family protein [Alphaproteobacteria bacterium]
MKSVLHLFWLPVLLVSGEVEAQSIQHSDLQDSARIVREANGIPHIFAENEHDLYFLQGWVHAEDRLFQMDVLRRSVSGRLAELLGPDALESDVQARTIGLGRAAQLSLEAFAEPVRQALNAYSEGVNAFLETAPALPPEYGALGLASVEPWTPLDSSMVAKAIGFATSFAPEKEIALTLALQAYVGSARARNEAVGQEVFNGAALFFEDVFRVAPFDPVLTAPRPGAASTAGVVAVAPNHGALSEPAIVSQGRRYLERRRRLGNLPGTLLHRGGPSGSNQWVIGGAHTPNGRPMLANDVHQPLGNPALWHTTHLSMPGLDVIGDDVAGAPFIVFGHNNHVTWGISNARFDGTDVFAEAIVLDPGSPSGLSILHGEEPEPILPLPQTYKANIGGQLVDVTGEPGIPPVVLVVPRRGNGPIVTEPIFDPDTGIGTALSIQSVGFAPTRDLEGIYRINHARTLDEFRDA